MQHNKAHFLQLAYNFYPKGISYHTDAAFYGQTPEFQNLLRMLQERKYLDSKWQELLRMLQARFECQDIGAPDSLIRAFRVAIALRAEAALHCCQHLQTHSLLLLLYADSAGRYSIQATRISDLFQFHIA